MVDREARNQALKAIDEFMDDQLDSMDFDEILDDIDFETKDETFKKIRPTLLLTYDFLSAHMVDVDLPKWKYLNRIRLLLQSDAELVVRRKWRWTRRQTTALLTLLSLPFLFLVFTRIIFYFVGPRTFKQLEPLWLFLSMIPFAWVSSRLLRFSDPDIRLNPFSCAGDILAVRRTVPTFLRKPYPIEIANRRHSEPYCRSPIRTKPRNWIENGLVFGNAVAFVFMTPFFLLYQMFPEQQETHELVLPPPV